VSREVERIGADVQVIRQRPIVPGTYGGGPPMVPGGRDPGTGAEPTEPAPAGAPKTPTADELPTNLAHFVKQLKDPDAGTRWIAVDELARSGDKRVVAHLLAVLKDRDAFVRRVCAESFGELGARNAVGSLIEALADDESIVRDAAHRSVRKLTGKDFGFDPEGKPDKRSQALKRWSDWWESSREDFLAGK
jgi:hypothetical protein